MGCAVCRVSATAASAAAPDDAGIPRVRSPSGMVVGGCDPKASRFVISEQEAPAGGAGTCRETVELLRQPVLGGRPRASSALSDQLRGIEKTNSPASGIEAPRTSRPVFEVSKARKPGSKKFGVLLPSWGSVAGCRSGVAPRHHHASRQSSDCSSGSAVTTVPADVATHSSTSLPDSSTAARVGSSPETDSSPEPPSLSLEHTGQAETDIPGTRLWQVARRGSSLQSLPLGREQRRLLNPSSRQPLSPVSAVTRRPAAVPLEVPPRGSPVSITPATRQLPIQKQPSKTPSKGRVTSDSLLPRLQESRSIPSCRLVYGSIQDFYAMAPYVLGTGISGAVRMARSRRNGGRYAIKTLSLVKAGLHATAQILNEVDIFLSLDHPNIAKLVQVVRSADAFHLVMEHCSGGELFDRVSELRRNEKLVRRLTGQMLSVINYCHQNGVCHRDIKLENWVFGNRGPDSTLKLIDFGLARRFNPGSYMTAVFGTVYYVSPEVINRRYDHRCDLWSLGIIVYIILSGSLPFDGCNDADVMRSIMEEEISLDKPQWKHVSPLGKNFVISLLKRNPELRLTVEQALQHPWIASSVEPIGPYFNQFSGLNSLPPDAIVAKLVHRFSQQATFCRAVLKAVALHITGSILLPIEKLFRAVDYKHDGTLKYEWLSNALVRIVNIPEATASSLVQRLNYSGNDSVSYSDFVATVLLAHIERRNFLEYIFYFLDVDQDHTVSASDIRAIMGNTLEGVETSALLAQVASDPGLTLEKFKLLFIYP